MKDRIKGLFKNRIVGIAIIISLIAPLYCYAGIFPSFKISAELRDKISRRDENETYNVWAMFKDKGDIGSSQLNKKAFRQISERSLKRRAKVLPQEELVDFRDMPVYEEYIEGVKKTGANIRVVSRWLNGVSVSANAEQIEGIKELSYVKLVESVKHYRRFEPSPSDISPKILRNKEESTSTTIDYGLSFGQLNHIGVIGVHDMGYHGEGVRICLLDTGYEINHNALSGINIVAQRDFINKDDVVRDEPGQDGRDEHGRPQESHGTWVLSTIGGYDPGNFVGAAFGSEFALAKTEDVSSETPIEEDFWVAGIEWADSLGADVVSSSLGYNIWDEGTGESYTLKDLDGKTAKTTIAAQIAVLKGITVVVSAGNQGNTPWQKITVPADAESVITVGAIDAGNGLATFSSLGPTADNRIKPDVVARGINVVVASSNDPNSYESRNGTSFSAPLVAGACVLLLQINPSWGPAQIIGSLKETAKDLGPSGPDTLYGWGLVDAHAAARLAAADTLNTLVNGEDRDPIFDPSAPSGQTVVESPFPNPSSASIFFPISLAQDSAVYLSIFSSSGELVRSIIAFNSFLQAGDYTKGSRVPFWNGQNASGEDVSSGIYYYLIQAKDFEKTGKIAIKR